jgi:hypothetical protein
LPPRDTGRPGSTTPGAPVEVARRGHLRMLQDPSNTPNQGNTEQA